MRWAAQRIKDGYISEWTVANCFSYVSLFVKLPKMSEILPNTTPFVGAVAIFNYNGVKHIAYIKELHADGFIVKEANYRPAVVDEREVNWNDKALVGFWAMPISPDKIVH